MSWQEMSLSIPGPKHKCFAAAIFIGLLAQSASGAIVGLERLAFGLDHPVYATHPPGDRDRLFVVEKGGSIKILNLNSNTITSTFLHKSITNVNASGEGGLLGLAFHPNYNDADKPGYRKFYVHVTADDSIPSSAYTSQIHEYSVSSNPNFADPSSKRELLNWVQPNAFHNAGWIGFNPQTAPNDPQYLYILSGDGGPQGDPNNNSQRLDTKLGKVLRIDVDGRDAGLEYAIPSDNPFVDAPGDDEIWAYGLRNPWRGSFDRVEGDLWIGDVGFHSREEINRQFAGSAGGANYGWRLQEGSATYGGPAPPDHVPPVYDYPHGNTSFTGNSVVGGYVYRGPDPDVYGTYLFGDAWYGGKIWNFNPENPAGSVQNITGLLVPNAGQINFPVSFAEDAVGNLYIIEYSDASWQAGQGEVFRIRTNKLLAGDYNADGDVDELDYAEWRGTFGATGLNLAADGNRDGKVDAADYVVWRSKAGTSIHDAGAGAVTSTVGRLGVPEPALLTVATQCGALIVVFDGSRRRKRIRNSAFG